MSERAMKIVETAVNELWGWHPTGRSLTPQQQCGCVLDELRYLFRINGLKPQRLVATIAGHSGELVVDVLVQGVAFTKRYPPRDGGAGGDEPAA